ncbi:MAG: mechanosensitive ion channel [Proteobacteria bacterium]|nr:mechanosensitive ion channel [Pseudomonadota bacterium]
MLMLLWLALLWLAPLAPAAAQQTPPADASPAIAAADIPARADADEKFLLGVQRRIQMADRVDRVERDLKRQAAGLDELEARTERGDLGLLSVQRLESLERHWQLKDRVLAQTRAELARLTNAASDDAAELAARRAAWLATSTEPHLSPVLVRRADEMAAQVDRAQRALAGPLSRLLDLGRKSNALAAQVQRGLTTVVAEVAEQDRRLAAMDSQPLWQALREGNVRQSVTAGMRRSLEIETAFARDYDAANARILPVLAAACALLLPLVFWFRRRATRLVAAGQLGESALLALARPWAAWLLLVAAIAVAYGLQGPNLRQQLVMLLAWVPVLALMQRRMLTMVGPWAYLSAVFYFVNMIVSLLVGNALLYRLLLLAVTLLMLLTLAQRLLRARGGEPSEHSFRSGSWKVVAWAACAALSAAALSNLLGNVSLSAMLVSATLDSSYAALAIYAASKVVVALAQVLLAGATMARFVERYSSSLGSTAVTIGRVLLVAAWLLFTLRSFRVYRPLSSFAMEVLTHKFQIGELSLSLGSLVSFALATMFAFWLARTIRQVLAEDVLPGLSLPRGVGNSVSSLTYYVVLLLGMLAALAAAGFQIGQLTLILGALGVGIGFGLQDVVRSFVAGLILMFERPLQPGDIVEVTGVLGQVREIGLRATVVTTFDGADVVVPNGMLLADKMTNWTLHGTRRRFELTVSTHYAADPQRTMDLLLQIARSCKGVAAVPAADCIMIGLAPGELQFGVRAWVHNFEDWLNVRTELALKIRNGLAEAGIEVPRPQREVVVRHLPPQDAGLAPGPAAGSSGLANDPPRPA